MTEKTTADVLADARREWQKATDAAVAAYADRDAALERLGAVLAERDQLARLHEVATERVVGYAAVIERARVHLQVIDGADLDIANGRPVMDAVEEKALSLRLMGSLLASADTDAALRERDAEKWDEGFMEGWKGPTLSCDNPYREGAKTDG